MPDNDDPEIEITIEMPRFAEFLRQNPDYDPSTFLSGNSRRCPECAGIIDSSDPHYACLDEAQSRAD